MVNFTPKIVSTRKQAIGPSIAGAGILRRRPARYPAILTPQNNMNPETAFNLLSLPVIYARTKSNKPSSLQHFHEKRRHWLCSESVSGCLIYYFP